MDVDRGPCKKALSTKDPLKTLETRVSSEMGTGIDEQRSRWARWAKGYTHMRLNWYRIRQSLAGLSAHYVNSYIS